MGNSRVRNLRQSTAHRELITYVIEQPIVVSTASIVRIDSVADAPRNGGFSDERSAVERPIDSHKV
jgi:hypothetical protein